MQMVRRLLIVVSTALAAVTLGTDTLRACTAFCASGNGLVLVGNNEDASNPRTKLWFIPAKDGAHGRLYVGADDGWPRGGMNERGLWFDVFWVPYVTPKDSGLPRFPGNLVDRAMGECATVDDVVRLFSQYDRAFLSEAVYMFADANGDAVTIEMDAIVRKTRSHFVQANFHQSRSINGNGERRFTTATAMLETAGGDVSVDLFRRILASTYQRGSAPTLYSNIYDLKSRTMRLYYFHDFERAVTFQLDQELKKGARELDIPALFPHNAAAEKYAARRAPPASAPLGPFMTGLGTITALVLAAVVFGAIRGGRRFRAALAGVAIALALVVGAAAVAINVHPHPSSSWTNFSLGPASGTSTWIGSNGINSQGIPLTAIIATAYDIPAVRIVGPEWLSHTRYAMAASLPADTEEAFRGLLRQELDTRLHLRTHTETRPFDVLVLTATDDVRVERLEGNRPNVWVHDSGMDAQEAPMALIASTIQNVLKIPVIDETQLTGTFALELEWTADRLASVTAGLERLGLRLTRTQRPMKVLVVDEVRRDAGLVLMDRVGQLTSGAPPQVRRAITDLLTVR